jgi:hypothetical protein
LSASLNPPQLSSEYLLGRASRKAAPGPRFTPSLRRSRIDTTCEKAG